MQSELFQIETETTWEDLGNGVQRKIYGYDDKIMLVKAKFEAGAIGPLHEHYHVQVTYVESGVFEVIIGDEKKILKQGDVFFIPPSIDHGVVALEEGILVDSFNPMRADFIQ